MATVAVPKECPQCGYADIRLYRDGGKLIVVDTGGTWTMADPKTKQIVIVEKQWGEHEPATFLGKATFDENDRWVFRSAKTNEYEKPYVLKGG